jgi:hypothetical protein
VHDIDLGLYIGLSSLVCLFGGGVGALEHEVVAADFDGFAVGFVDDAVDFFEVVDIADDFVVGEDVLFRGLDFAEGEGAHWQIWRTLKGDGGVKRGRICEADLRIRDIAYLVDDHVCGGEEDVF